MSFSWDSKENETTPHVVICPHHHECESYCVHRNPHLVGSNCFDAHCYGRPVKPCADSPLVWVYEEQPA